MTPVVISRTREPVAPTDEQQLRLEWAANLKAELKAKRMTTKSFHFALSEAGATVTPQAVYNWLNGATAPSPINQAYCAHVLRAPAHRLFALPEIAR